MLLVYIMLILFFPEFSIEYYTNASCFYALCMDYRHIEYIVIHLLYCVTHNALKHLVTEFCVHTVFVCERDKHYNCY